MLTRLRKRPSRREGFTLIEVLIAMVILAVGLLAVEAMGIGAARLVARADRQGEFTALATRVTVAGPRCSPAPSSRVAPRSPASWFRSPSLRGRGRTTFPSRP